MYSLLLIVKFFFRNESVICIMCGIHSKQPRPRDYIDTYESCDSSSQFIECLVCGECSCYKCVSSICTLMEKNNDHVDDKWYENVKRLMKFKQYHVKIVGHCCEVRQEIESTISKNDNLSVIDDYPFCGYLHFPQCYVLLPPPLHDYIDIHGFGIENDLCPGLLHAVVSKKTAIECHNKYIIPDGTGCTWIHKGKFYDIDFKNIYFQKIKLKCFIQVVKINLNIDDSNYRHNEVSWHDVQTSTVLTPPNKNCVWIVLASTDANNCHCHLLTARWPTDVCNAMTDDQKKQFYYEMLSATPKEGWESTRKGGSNGETTYDNFNILKFLNTNSAFIRRGKGVKLIKKRTTWNCYYISSGGIGPSQHHVTRNPVCWKYSQPQQGGQVVLNDYLYKKYSFIFKAMTKAKYDTVKLILLLQNKKVIPYIIQQEATKAGNNDIERATKKVQMTYNKVTQGKFVKELTMCNKFTIVAYPVAYHYDVFKQNQHSLENKICLSFPSDCRGNIGRGGDGINRWVFALLDWTNTNSGRRRSTYRANGGVLGLRQPLTQTMIDDQRRRMTYIQNGGELEIGQNVTDEMILEQSRTNQNSARTNDDENHQPEQM